MEAKFAERDLIKAIAKVQNDYLKHHEVLNIRGGFAILYPHQLSKPMPESKIREVTANSTFKLVAMFPPEDSRAFKVTEGTFSEISQVLAGYVLKPPELAEPSIDFIISSLRDSAMYILNGMKHLASRDLEGFFGGRDVFKNILQYEEKNYPVQELKIAAAYLLINQLLFYQILSRIRPDLEEIDVDTIKRPSDLNSYFAKVLEINYRLVFSYDVAALLPEYFLDEIITIINVIKGISPEKVGGDLLGTIFHDLIPFNVRKTVAAFYTNPLAAELLSNLSIDSPNAQVGDLAVGSGGLLVAAYRRKKKLLSGKITQEIHRRFVEEQLLGIDVMPFAANVAACHLALQSASFLTNKILIAIWDSTDLLPGMTIPSMAELRTVLRGQTFLETYTRPKPREKGSVRLRKQRPEEVNLGSLDVAIMNPPFTRQERLPREYKELLNDRFADYGRYLHGQLGYYGYFVMLADRFLKEGGKMALVLPASALRLRSTAGLRNLWANKYHIEHIVTTSNRSAFSESVRFREILLVAKKTKFREGITTVSVLKKLPETVAEVHQLEEKIRGATDDFEDDHLALKRFEYGIFTRDRENWFRFISLSDPKLIARSDDVLSSEKLMRFSKIGNTQRTDLDMLRIKDFNAFILRKEEPGLRLTDVWVFERFRSKNLVAKNRKLGTTVTIPKNILSPALRRLSYVKTMSIDGRTDFVMLKWFDGIRKLSNLSLSADDLHELERSRIEEWRGLFDSRKSHLLFARRFDLSAPGTSLLAFYSSTPVVGIDMWSIRGVNKQKAKILTLWFNSTPGILQTLIERAETRGAWMKIHHYILERMFVPNFDRMTKIEAKNLEAAFDSVKNLELPSILEQLRARHPVRLSVDRVWLKFLGYKEDIDLFLYEIYDSIIKEIELLKQIMSEEV